MQPLEIKAVLQRFVRYVTEPGEKEDAALLELCDRILVAYHDVNYTFDDHNYPDAPKEEYASRRDKISALFPNYGYYCLTSSQMEVFEPDAMVGDAIDDLADLSQDFEEILWCFEHTSVDDALWHFQNGYWLHWGRHMRELQLYLFGRVTGS